MVLSRSPSWLGLGFPSGGGPGTDNPNRHWEHNGLLFAFNPVACDRVQLGIIQEERKRRGRPDLFERGNTPIHVEQATSANLGVANLNVIN